MRYTDEDLLYDMISCLDYDAFQYGNDGEWYAQGEYHNIDRFENNGSIVVPYGATDEELKRYEENKPKGFWKIYI